MKRKLRRLKEGGGPMVTATAERPKKKVQEPRRYNITEAAEYVSKRVGAPISARGFRSWVDKKVIPYLRSPGARGHYFWNDPLLDRISAMIQVMETLPAPSKNNAKKKK